MRTILTFAILLALTSCAPSIDASSVKAKAGAPIAATVDEVALSRNESHPLVYLVVEPVRVSEESRKKVTKIDASMSATGKGAVKGEVNIINSSYRNYLLSRQRQISLQLTSALAGIGDFRIIDYEAYTDAPKAFKVQSENLGPYFVRAVITECDERIVSDKRKLSLPLLYRSQSNLTEGVVGLDVSVISAKNGELAAGFSTQGTFLSSEKSSKSGFIATINKSDMKMKSTIEQALRVALNQAALKLHNRLYSN